MEYPSRFYLEKVVGDIFIVKRIDHLGNHYQLMPCMLSRKQAQLALIAINKAYQQGFEDYFMTNGGANVKRS